MDKKAVSHVDWAISMGIFLVYVLSMFVMIQPGIQPFYRENTMISIAEEQLQLDIYYNITRIPLYIKVYTDPYTDRGRPGHFQVTFPKDYNLIDRDDDLNITFRPDSSSEEYIGFDQLGVSLNIKIAIPPTFSTIEGSQTRAPGGTYLFWVYYAPDKYGAVKHKPGLGNKYSESDVHFGVPEVLEGIDLVKLDSIKLECTNTKTYLALKEKWGYPAGKDFAIYYVQSATIPYDLNSKIDVCNVATPYDQSNVYVKEWGDWILNSDGTRVPVIFNLRVW